MVTLYTIIIIMAVMIQAFFTASEMAFISVSKSRLKGLVDSGNKRALKLNDFLEDQGMYLGTTLVGTNIAVVVASVLATRILTGYFGFAIAPLLTTCIMVPVTLVFAEIIPKIIARQFAMSIAINLVTPLRSFYKVFHPLIVAVNFIGKSVLFLFEHKRPSDDLTVTKSDLKRLILLGHETGEVEADEVELIHKVLDFEDIKVEKIMVPLFRVSSLGVEDTVEDLKKLVSLTGFSRIPIYKGNKRNIVGTVNIYDILFKAEEDETGLTAEDFLREAVCIKRKDGLDIALARLRHKKRPMGIVVDKDENVVGIITIEDILEEIVGEI